MTHPKTITVGDLRKELAGYPDEAPLYFGNGDLRFSWVKNRGPEDGFLLQIAFNEVYSVHPDCRDT